MNYRLLAAGIDDYDRFTAAVHERLTPPYVDAADETESQVLNNVAMALTFGGQTIPDDTSALGGFVEVLEGTASTHAAWFVETEDWVPGPPVEPRPPTGLRDPLDVIEHPNEYGIELLLRRSDDFPEQTPTRYLLVLRRYVD